MACAQTGSGKTAAFCFPIVSGVMRQQPVPKPCGTRTVFPLALILSPTRELSSQIHVEARKFTYQTGVKVVVVYGGAAINQQKKCTEAYDDTSMDEFGLKLTEAALEKMHYLHAALSETLRLCPAVPLDGKSAVEDDVLPDRFRIKKGDSVAYIPYPMGRMTYIWGEDAEKFRPERWLNNGVFQLESPFKFTAFQFATLYRKKRYKRLQATVDI